MRIESKADAAVRGRRPSPMKYYDVIGSNGPTDQRCLYSARRLKDARAVAQAVHEAGGAFIGGVWYTFQAVQVFGPGKTFGRLVATYGRPKWQEIHEAQVRQAFRGRSRDGRPGLEGAGDPDPRPL